MYSFISRMFKVVKKRNCNITYSRNFSVNPCLCISKPRQLINNAMYIKAVIISIDEYTRYLLLSFTFLAPCLLLIAEKA